MMVASRAAAGSSGTANQPAGTLAKPTKPKGRPLTMDEYFDRLEVGQLNSNVAKIKPFQFKQQEYLATTLGYDI